MDTTRHRQCCTGNRTSSAFRRQVEAAGGGGGAGDSAADRRHALGWTALMVAAANDQVAAVRELLRLGASPDLQERYAGAAAAAAAAGLHPLDAMQRREEDFCASMNARASFLGWTPLHYAALADSPAVAGALLDAGANPTQRDHAGRRALHYTRDPSPTRELILQVLRDPRLADASAPAVHSLISYSVGSTRSGGRRRKRRPRPRSGADFRSSSGSSSSSSASR